LKISAVYSQLAARLKGINEKNKMFAKRMKIESHRTVSTSRFFGKSLPLPTLNGHWREIEIYE
jgi:hypothetical protein